MPSGSFRRFVQLQVHSQRSGQMHKIRRFCPHVEMEIGPMDTQF